MKFYISAASLLLAAIPAHAAVIVQTDSEAILSGFRGFDSSLGRLDKVTIDVSLTKFRAWQIDVPATGAASVDVGWSINGIWRLHGFAGGVDPFELALTGSGTKAVALTSNYEGRSYGNFDIMATGSASVDAPVDRFIDRYVVLDGFDTGYLDATGADTTFTVPGAARLLRYSGGCNTTPTVVIRTGEDFCGTALYRLTYDYTPAGTVPEPASWGMMIVGFGLMGGTLRRRRSVSMITSVTP